MTATLDSVVITRQVLKEEQQYVLQCSVCGVQFSEAQRMAAERHVAEHSDLKYENTTGYGGVYVTASAVYQGHVMHKAHGRCKIEFSVAGWYVHVEREVYCGGGDYQTVDVLIHVDTAYNAAKEKLREFAEEYRHLVQLRKKLAP